MESLSMLSQARKSGARTSGLRKLVVSELRDNQLFVADTPEFVERSGAQVDTALTKAGLSQIDAIMAVWNPVGYLQEEVIQVLGEPTVREPSQIVYYYDEMGLGGVAWVLELGGSQNRVVGVKKVWGE